ncbi:MAG: CYTH domain-containing protein, partial [Candidatus Hodarchaeota archaeon]
MSHKKINFEFKARCENPSNVLSFLENAGAVYKGLDHQIDTYFQVKFGRLKLREGNIESNLIWYDRLDSIDSKKSEVLLFKPGKDSVLKEILTASLGILVVVDKLRKIYFLENVKFHIDEIKDLGN